MRATLLLASLAPIALAACASAPAKSPAPPSDKTSTAESEKAKLMKPTPAAPSFEDEVAFLRTHGMVETHRTFHFTGTKAALEPVATSVLGVSTTRMAAGTSR